MTLSVLHLTEHKTTRFAPDELPASLGEQLWTQYSDRILVEPPSFKTGNHWLLTPQGWAGHIPIDHDHRVFIEPKVEISSLFQMLEYAYRLTFLAPGEMVGASSMLEFYERLAKVLALRILDRSRKGFHREYVARSNKLPYLRGKLNLDSMLRTPTEVSLDCSYHENTADIEDNQILAWTLYCIARHGFGRSEVAQLVRRAFRAVHSAASLNPCSPSVCTNRAYTRLNNDYSPMHALCRFFLEHGGPGHQQGSRSMLPFLVNMPRLYELFVAEWLRMHLPDNLTISEQYGVPLGHQNAVRFEIDLLICDRHTGQPLVLLDTKYKTPNSPSASDLEQVIAYAKAISCERAMLVYPQELPTPFDHTVGGDIHVWTAAFALTGDIDENGRKFLVSLLAQLERSTPT
ncbi:McrC family protein [Bythopirellula goksoeyrii]|uniref:5-methylcytosine-specific restriction enzyme subunit McrC n=1 Tax=Bythopirellula goksoeyrii TaxID=1400387 RepID=A0A5B9QJ11_9BACT|nr:restriction endonuclease [Bythopirellula goksoeyrii]QEG37702.1 5-methylcytosine-specific restriction enzyme subunit McrC [Bythopirellula goksoeyrii]